MKSFTRFPHFKVGRSLGTRLGERADVISLVYQHGDSFVGCEIYCRMTSDYSWVWMTFVGAGEGGGTKNLPFRGKGHSQYIPSNLLHVSIGFVFETYH